jgi:hypothetical protein
MNAKNKLLLAQGRDFAHAGEFRKAIGAIEEILKERSYNDEKEKDFLLNELLEYYANVESIEGLTSHDRSELVQLNATKLNNSRFIL